MIAGSAWMTVEEAAEVLGVHPQTLWRWAREGTEPAPRFVVRWGRRNWRVNRAALETYAFGELGVLDADDMAVR